MTTALLRDGFPSTHRTTRERIESSIDLRRLFFAIDSDPALIGAGVVYIDEDFNVVTLREFQAICSVSPIKVVLREAPRSVGPVEFTRMLEHEPRESELMREALTAGVTRAGALLSWHVIYSGIALMPFTAGTSVVISFIGTAAAVAGLFQCAAGAYRTVNEVWDPQMNNRREHFYIVDPHPLWTSHRLALFGGVLALCFSIATAGTLMNLTYFADASDEFTDSAFFIAGGIACVIFGIAQSLVLHGYPGWVWLQVGVFMSYLLLVVPTIIYSPDHLLFTLTLLSPLTGLLCLNSNRQREMRREMLEIRHKRNGVIVPLKKQGRWKWW